MTRPTIPHDLIKNLCASNAEQDAESLIFAIRQLGVKHGLSLEIQREIAALAIDFRKQAIENALESARLVIQEGVERWTP